jgi:hypothetical protein
MPTILNGKIEPRIVLMKNGKQVDDFTLDGYEAGPDAPDYLSFEPVFLSDVLDSEIIVSDLRGFRMDVQLYWPELKGDELNKMKRLFDRRAYDTVLFYPWKTEKPNYFETMKLQEDTVNLSYSFRQVHRNFLLKLESVKIVDYVPLEMPEFLSWGNITLKFAELNTLPYSSYMRKITRLQSGGGTIQTKTSGYFKYGTTEGVNGTFIGLGDCFTDITTVVHFLPIADAGRSFVKWQIDGVDYSTEQEIILTILNDIELIAIFA